MNKKSTILIVDDCELNRAILVNIIKDKYNYIEATDGNNAIEIISSNMQIDCILLDIFMPNKDGFQVLRELREKEFSDIPVIVISSSNDDNTEEEVLKLGASDFFYKPFVENILLLKIDNNIKKSEIIKLKAYEKKLQLDSLTKVYTKDVFFNVASKYIEEHKNSKLALVVTDIRNFTQINTLFGRKKADEILISEANLLIRMCTPHGLPFGRFENDSFCFIIPDDESIYENFGKTFKPKLFKKILNFDVQVLFGIYRINDTIPVEEMCHYALLACKKIKVNGTKIAFFDDNLRELVKLEDEITEKMVEALKNNEFVVYYQPVMALNNLKVVSCEALVRWNSKTRGLIPPNIFIPIFEKNGFIAEMDRYVWDRVCSDLKKTILKNPVNVIPVSFNISRIDFFNENLVNDVNEILKKYDIPKEYVRIEITESAFQDDVDSIIKIANEFKENGYKILMDDFGTGYSSLESLEDIPVDIIKLDMKFMKNLGVNSKTAIIVSSILRMCKLLGLEVVAEGIETNEQLEFLKSIGCEYGQGYLYSKPISYDEFQEFVRVRKVSPLEVETFDVEYDLKSIWDAETNFSSLFNKMVTIMGVFEYSSEIGLNIVRVNNAFLDFVGGKRIDKFSDPNIPFQREYSRNKKSLDRLIKEAVESKKIVSDVFNFKKYDGEEYRARLKLKFLGKLSSRDQFIFSLYDITTEAKLAIENELLLENTPGFTSKYTYNVKSGELTLESIRGHVFDILGFNIDEYKNTLKEKPETIIYEEDIKICQECLTTLFNNGKVSPISLRFYNKNRRIVWLTLYYSLTHKNSRTMEFYVNAIDTTKEFENTKKLKFAIEKYRLLVQGLCVITFDYDVDLDILSYETSDGNDNVKSYELFDYLKNVSNSKTIHEISRDGYINKIIEAVKNGGKGQYKFLSDIFGNGYRWLLASFRTLKSDDGKVHHVYGRVDDIDDLQKQNYKLIEEANEDYLTGLFNRKHFEYILKLKYKEFNNSFLVFLDIDNFKKFNDTYGHNIGDRVLKEFGLCVKKYITQENILCRFGGDEFVFILNTYQSEDEVIETIKNIHDELNKNLTNFVSDEVRFSYGMSRIDVEKPFDDLLKIVDEKMYKDKRS